MGLAFGKCPQHLLSGGVKLDATDAICKTSSAGDLKELTSTTKANDTLEDQEDLSQCCCWQVWMKI